MALSDEQRSSEFLRTTLTRREWTSYSLTLVTPSRASVVAAVEQSTKEKYFHIILLEFFDFWCGLLKIVFQSHMSTSRRRRRGD